MRLLIQGANCSIAGNRAAGSAWHTGKIMIFLGTGIGFFVGIVLMHRLVLARGNLQAATSEPTQPIEGFPLRKSAWCASHFVGFRYCDEQRQRPVCRRLMASPVT
jgi:hypothetical protein